MQVQLGGFVVVIVSSSNLFCFHSSQPNQLTSTAKVSSSRPTAGSKTRERELVTLDGPIVRVLDRYSLKKAPGKGYASYIYTSS